MHGIYKIFVLQNKANGKVFINKTCRSLKAEKAAIFKAAHTHTKYDIPLYADIRSNGDDFVIREIERLKPIEAAELLRRAYVEIAMSSNPELGYNGGLDGGFNNRLKTHCKYGHPFSGENLHIATNGRRVCQICNAANRRKWVSENREKANKQKTEWAAKNRHKVREYKSQQYPHINRRRLEKSYGTTPEQVKQWIAEQGHVCKICKKPFSHHPNIDHDHKTQNVRGILCHRCNMALGLLRDDPSLMLAAASYIQKSHLWPQPLTN